MEQKGVKKIKKVELDTSTPVDVEKGMKIVSPELFFKLLPSYEDSGFLENLFYIAFAVQVGNYGAMMQKAHSIKGSGGYAGASRVCLDCYWIQYWFEERKYVKMMESYLQLVEHAAQFRIHWRKRYYEHLKEPYFEAPEHIKVPLPFGWRLERLSEEEFKVHYPDDYLDLALEAERTGKKYIKKKGDKFEIQYDNLSEDSSPFPSSEKSEENAPSLYESFSKAHLPVYFNPYLAPSDDSDLDDLDFGQSKIMVNPKRSMPLKEDKKNKTFVKKVSLINVQMTDLPPKFSSKCS
ncbi:unnamed protein product [Moneuplotes crassus]|uniref:Uncharacterized protein n=1 Tax=Euplotes crassus TaxID=5936 RepID=A0AAD2DAD3_EUPCR|nr:unnamed protein product [Moneuplotes crassus]